MLYSVPSLRYVITDKCGISLESKAKETSIIFDTVTSPNTVSVLHFPLLKTASLTSLLVSSMYANAAHDSDVNFVELLFPT